MNDDFLDRLASDAVAVRRVDSSRFATLFGLAALTSAAIIVGLSGMRADLAEVVVSPMFLWKLAAMGTVALLAVPMLAAAGRPGAATPRIGHAAIAGLVLLGLPLVYAVATQPPAESMNGLEATRGLGCLFWTVAASVPVWLASLVWLREAAPTDLGRASWSAGIASGAVAATLFVLHCPYDDIVYVAVWYGASVALVAGFTRLLLPRLIRW